MLCVIISVYGFRVPDLKYTLVPSVSRTWKKLYLLGKVLVFHIIHLVHSSVQGVQLKAAVSSALPTKQCLNICLYFLFVLCI